MKQRDVALLVAWCISAFAANVRADQLTLTDGAGVAWEVNFDMAESSTAFSTTSTYVSSASGAAREAQFTAPVVASTAGGGTSMTTLSDMFDGFGTFAIANAMPATTSRPTIGSTGVEYYRQVGVHTLSCSGREMIFPTLSSTLFPGLQLSRRVFVPTGDSFIRWTNVLTNTTSADIVVFVGGTNNLGSDSGTEITGSSSGDMLVTTADTWATSRQEFAGDGSSSDPRTGIVVRGTGTDAAIVVSANFEDGDDQPFWWYRITVPAGATRFVVMYATPAGTVAASQAQATELADLENASSTECFTPTERRDIANFAAICTPGTEGEACDDGDAGTTGEICTAGVCGTGAGTDAGVATDAGVPDAGVATDAGEAMDAGVAVDAGEATDAGTETDAGGESDAGAGTDTGAGTDGGAGTDTGAGTDGGARTDTGTSGVDAGTTGGSSGCGCAAAGTGRPASAMLALFGLVAVLVRRRRR